MYNGNHFFQHCHIRRSLQHLKVSFHLLDFAQGLIAACPATLSSNSFPIDLDLLVDVGNIAVDPGEVGGGMIIGLVPAGHPRLGQAEVGIRGGKEKTALSS